MLLTAALLLFKRRETMGMLLSGTSGTHTYTVELWWFFTGSPCSVLTSLWKEIPGGESRGHETRHHCRSLCLRYTLTLSPNAVLSCLGCRPKHAWQLQKSLWGQGTATVSGDQPRSRRALGYQGKMPRAV